MTANFLGLNRVLLNMMTSFLPASMMQSPGIFPQGCSSILLIP